MLVTRFLLPIVVVRLPLCFQFTPVLSDSLSQSAALYANHELMRTVYKVSVSVQS